jgi:hypothetical protein
MLLDACVALGLLERDGDLYRNGPEARDMLVPGAPGYIGDLVAHQEDLWSAWGNLAEAVRSNRRVGERRPSDGATHRNFMLAMHNRAVTVAPAVAEALDLDGRRQLFDVGGGPATFSITLAGRWPQLRAIVFDLPETIAIAEEMIAAAGAGERVSTRPGDYFRDDFGAGNDVVLLSAILHSMGPGNAAKLLRKAHDSLVAGGMVVIHEGLVDASGTGPLRAVLFSLNMLVNTGEGQSYSAEALTTLLTAEGFRDVCVLPLPPAIGTSLVTAVKP